MKIDADGVIEFPAMVKHDNRIAVYWYRDGSTEIVQLRSLLDSLKSPRLHAKRAGRRVLDDIERAIQAAQSHGTT